MSNMRTASGAIVALLALALAAIHALAQEYSLYWSLDWFDIPVHFLGGVVVGGAFVWFFTFEFPRMPHRLLAVIALSLIIVVTWEVFEYTTGTYGALHCWTDTGLDLAMDDLGVALAYASFRLYVR